ncbi:hypothetical protein ACI0FR_03241 [Paenochrobactrum sp. BZR 201-1]
MTKRSHFTKQLQLDAFEQAISKRKAAMNKDLTYHSVRGYKYLSIK